MSYSTWHFLIYWFEVIGRAVTGFVSKAACLNVMRVQSNRVVSHSAKYFSVNIVLPLFDIVCINEILQSQSIAFRIAE